MVPCVNCKNEWHESWVNWQEVAFLCITCRAKGFSIEEEEEESHPQDECICVQDENNPNCPWCF